MTAALVYQGYTATFAQPAKGAAQKADTAGPIEVREIDLSAIYSTSYQKKLKHIYERHLPEKSPGGTAFRSINDSLCEARTPPFLAVVRGEDFKEAVLATARFVKLKEPPARPIGPDDKSTSKKCWLFVHIAHASSSGPFWLVYPPTVYGKKVRFSYAHNEGYFSDELIDARSADDHSYFYWVPLGEVADPGEVKAELTELSKTVKASYPAKQKK
jgi:hypothetical protein